MKDLAFSSVMINIGNKKPRSRTAETFMLNKNQAVIDVIPAKCHICVISGAKHTDIALFSHYSQEKSAELISFHYGVKYDPWRFS